MHYREFKPNAFAARFVKCYWLIEDDAPLPNPQRVVPDGRAQLILNLAHPYETLTKRGWQLQPQCFFIGQITAPLLLRASGPFRMIGINFHPHTASQLLKLPISELTDTAAISLDGISARLFREFDRIQELRSPGEWFHALDHIIRSLAERRITDDRPLSAAIAELEQSGGLMKITAAADHIGLSSRQFERRFMEAVGITPKLFCRIQRFQRVFPILEAGNPGWADAAVQCGYYESGTLDPRLPGIRRQTPAGACGKGD
jgi:AraC-like DNA-binding protein